MIATLILGIALLSIGFVMGSYYKAFALEQKLNRVLKYDVDNNVWSEVTSFSSVQATDFLMVGFVLYPPSVTGDEKGGEIINKTLDK